MDARDREKIGRKGQRVSRHSRRPKVVINCSSSSFGAYETTRRPLRPQVNGDDQIENKNGIKQLQQHQQHQQQHDDDEEGERHAPLHNWLLLTILHKRGL